MNRGPGLGSLPVELFYEVQLFALSDTLPHACRHIYQVFKSAPPFFHAQYLLGRADCKGDTLTHALRYPLCTREVFDALRRYIGGTCSFWELPRWLFRDLPARGSEWTEHDHPLPFLKYLNNHSSIKESTINLRYALTEAGKAGFQPLISFLLDRKMTRGQTPLSWAAGKGYREVVKLLLARDGIDVNSKDEAGSTPLSLAADCGREGVVKLLLARDDIEVEVYA